MPFEDNLLRSSSIHSKKYATALIPHRRTGTNARIGNVFGDNVPSTYTTNNSRVLRRRCNGNNILMGFFFFFWLTKAARFTPYSYNGRRWPNFSYPTYRTLSRVSPKKVAPDSDIRFQAKFWDTIHAVLGTQLLKSSVNRPESDGQAERTIRTVTGLIEFSQTMTHKIGLSSFLC